MKRKNYIFIISLIIIRINNNGNTFSQEYDNYIYKIYGYDEIVINVNGNIVLKQFYGNPNYGETPEIDRIENCYVLILNEPIMFSDGIETVTVKEIQLIILSNNMYRNIILNRNYTIKGKAFFRQTGHHHTPIMLIVDEILMKN